MHLKSKFLIYFKVSIQEVFAAFDIAIYMSLINILIPNKHLDVKLSIQLEV